MAGVSVQTVNIRQSAISASCLCFHEKPIAPYFYEMGDAANASASVMDIKSVVVSVVDQRPRQRLVSFERGIETSSIITSSSVHPWRFCT